MLDTVDSILTALLVVAALMVAGEWFLRYLLRKAKAMRKSELRKERHAQHAQVG